MCIRDSIVDVEASSEQGDDPAAPRVHRQSFNHRHHKGAPVSYRAAKGFFDRLAGECGFPVRPHMLRHTAATNWVRAGVDIDVIQALLGHASLASTTVYLHARDDDKRRAVEAVAAGRRFR